MHHRILLTCLGLAAIALVLLVGPPVSAGDEDAEIGSLLERIEILVGEAKLLEKAGKHDLARALDERIEAIEGEVRRLRHAHEVDEAEDVEVEDLVAPWLRLARSLAENSGRKTDVEAVREVEKAMDRAFEILDEFAEKVDEVDDEAREEKTEAPAWKTQLSEERLQTLRWAMAAFREAEKARLVRQMDRVIHVYELAVAGHAHKEIEAALKEAPSRAGLAEMLAYAARLYRGWGTADRAEALEQFAKQLGARTDAGHHAALARLEQLEKSVDQILELTMGVKKELKELRKAMAR